MTELADAAGMTHQSMSTLVDELVDLSLVERVADPRDRRARLIVLAPPGHEVLARYRARIQELVELLDVEAGVDLGLLVDWLRAIPPAITRLGSPDAGSKVRTRIR